MPSLCAALFLAVAPPAALLPSEDWPQWGGPSRDFVGPPDVELADSWPADGPPRLWERALGPGHSGVVVAGGVVHTAYRDGSDDVVVALSAEDGALLWSHRDPAPALEFMLERYGYGPHATPLVTDELVLFAGSTGNLLALERGDGSPRWRARLWQDLEGTKLERGYAASPLLHAGSVIVPVGGRGQAVAAFRAKDGELLWSSGDDAAAYASPVMLDVDGEVQVCVLLDASLVGLEPRSGALLWSVPIDNSRYVHCTTPVTAPGGRVLVNTVAGVQLFQVTRADDGAHRAERLWKSRSLGSQDHNLLRLGERFLGSRSSTTLTTLDVATGRIGFRTRRHADSSVLVAGERLLTLSEDGELGLSRLRDLALEELASARILDGRCWAAPALAGTRFYVRDTERLLALELGPRD